MSNLAAMFYSMGTGQQQPDPSQLNRAAPGAVATPAGIQVPAQGGYADPRHAAASLQQLAHWFHLNNIPLNGGQN